MSDLIEYLEGKDLTVKVKQLKRKLELAHKQKLYYKYKVKMLEKLLPKSNKRVTRTQQAVALTKSGEYTIKEIAEMCFLTIQSVLTIRHRFKLTGYPR